MSANVGTDAETQFSCGVAGPQQPASVIVLEEVQLGHAGVLQGPITQFG